MKVDILAIGAHPDDVELSCAGTLLKHMAHGKKVAIVDLTCGELGTRGSGPLRLSEAEDARVILGVEERMNLGMADGFFEINEKSIKLLVQAIRLFQPEIILANALQDRHPDHGRAAKLVQEACFFSGLPKVETQFDGMPQLPWRPKSLYHYIQDQQLTPDFVVDITPFFETKMQAIQAFKSQFYNPASEEPESPISSKDFMDFMDSKARVFGRPIQATYAEGFNISRTIGVHNLFDLI